MHPMTRPPLPLPDIDLSRLLRRGAALMSGLLMSGLLMSGPTWAQVNPAQASRVTAASGQTAADIALDHVPAGISLEQFLLALYRQNPQVMAAGSLQALPDGTALMLPSAAQASAVAPDQARAQLLALRRAPPPVEPASALAEPMASSPQPAASQAGMGDAPTASPAPVARMPAASPAGASATGLPVDPLLIILGGGALLVILWLAFRRPDQTPAALTRSTGQKGTRARQAPAPARPQSDTTASVQAPERLRPSLPLTSDHRRPDPVAPPAAPIDAVPTPAAVSPAPPPVGLTRLSELGALPSLDLGGPGSPAPAPTEPMKPQVAQAGAPAPAAPAPGPLDLSGISLDLNDRPRS
jgi:pilus assembly protein FimV